MLLTVLYICSSSEGECIAEEIIEVDVNVEFSISSNVENQNLFEMLNKFGWDNENLICESVKEKIGDVPDPEEFHAHYFIMGIENQIVDFSEDFFDYGDNESMYFNLIPSN